MRVHGVVQHYAWGDRTAIPELLGVPADGRPWAEVWFGTHPGGPSTVDDGRPLSEVSGELPFLVKFLAAAEPLSLQTHPDTATAQAGFDREEAAGIALDDPRRIYRDRNAKPEILCALTPFDALSGFRPLHDTEALLTWLGAPDLAAHLRHHGLEATVAALYRGELDTDAVVEACAGHSSEEAQLVTALAAQYPGEPSVVVTLLLNRVHLEPGEAVFLGPGNLHAYLRGLGVEVMGASDNVVRGGLTVKHVDVDELLRVLRYEPLVDPVVRPIEQSPGVWVYETPDAPFVVERHDAPVHRTARSREVVATTRGSTAGAVAYLPAGESLDLDGSATVYIVGESA